MTVMSGGGLKTKSNTMKKHTKKESPESKKEMDKDLAMSKVKMLITKKRK